MKTKISAKIIAALGMFSAMSFVAVLCGRVIPNVAGFLSYDPKDAVVAIAGFMFGPVATVIIPVLVALVEMISISTTGPIGCLMNILSTISFALPAALIYRKMKSYRGALIGLASGVCFMTVVMLLWNYLITPIYMEVSRDVVVGMLMPVFLPFNAIKGGLNAALTLLLYKPLVTALRRAKLVPRTEHDDQQKRVRFSFLWIALALLAVFAVLFLLLIGVIG